MDTPQSSPDQLPSSPSWGLLPVKKEIFSQVCLHLTQTNNISTRLNERVPLKSVVYLSLGLSSNKTSLIPFRMTYN